MKACILSAAFLGLAPFVAEAASLSVAPASGSYAAGASFSVGVYVSTTADQPVNAISGTVSFPTDKLEVISLGTSGSIVSLFVADPSFSNTKGTVSFEGAVLNPGYAGTSGKVLTINFKTKTSGATAAVTFTGGRLLANDGLGTDILSGYGSGSYTLTTAAVPTAPVTPPAKPTVPTTTSSPSVPEAQPIPAAVDAEPAPATAQVSLSFPRELGLKLILGLISIILAAALFVVAYTEYLILSRQLLHKPKAAPGHAHALRRLRATRQEISRLSARLDRLDKRLSGKANHLP